MSHIDELVKQCCPGGVEFKALGQLGSIFGGLSGKTKADFLEGNSSYVSYSNVFGNPAVDLGALDTVRIGPAERQRSLRRGDILFTGSSETPNEVAMASVVVGEPPTPTYLNSFCIGLRLDDPTVLEPDFAKHLFRSRPIRQQLLQTASGVTRFNVSKSRLANVRVPLPPVVVQREIVNVLDIFATLEGALEAELGAEIEARAAQYAHLRELLLTHPSEIRRARVDDVLTMRAGKFIAAGDIQRERSGEAPYPCYGGNGLRGYVALPNQEGRHVLVGRQGALSGNVKRVDGLFYATEHAVVVTTGPDLDVDWSFHLLTAMNLNQYVSRGAQPGLAVRTLNELMIPVPPLVEQRRVASTLGNFDALVRRLSVHLPAELNARRTQYEHYRDRLLTFKELAA